MSNNIFNKKKRTRIKKKALKTTSIFCTIVLGLMSISIGIWYGIDKNNFLNFFSSTFQIESNESCELLKVHFLDVGQGDCIFIEFPDGKNMIIDSGNCRGYKKYETKVLDFLSSNVENNKIDYMMLTHADSDHCYYLDNILEQFQIDTIFCPNIKTKNPDEKIQSEKLDIFFDDDTINTKVYTKFFNDALLEENAKLILNVGEYEIEGEGYDFDFYCLNQKEWEDNTLKNSEEKNAVCPIGILEYKNKRVVFTGDSNKKNEKIFLEHMNKNGVFGIDCDVLKVAHHGSESSSTDNFLDFVDCEYGVVSANSEGNSFGLPSPKAINRLKNNDMQIFRTDQNGDIVLSVGNDIKFDLQKSA